MTTTERPPFPGTEKLDPTLVFSQPGYTSIPARSNRWALIALLTAIGHMVIPIVGLVVSLVSVTMAWIKLDRRSGRDVTLVYAATVLNGYNLVMVAMMVYFLWRYLPDWGL